jgi:small subunit ribosomal protein S16
VRASLTIRIPGKGKTTDMLKIRLRRVGGTNAPAYRIVVSDGRRTPTAKIVEELGSYDPTKNPPTLTFDREKARAWIVKGAQPSDTIKRLLLVKG